MKMDETVYLYKGEVFYFKDSPLKFDESYSYYPDGALVVCRGKIIEAGAYENIKERYPEAFVTDYSGKLLIYQGEFSNIFWGCEKTQSSFFTSPFFISYIPYNQQAVYTTTCLHNTF